MSGWTGALCDLEHLEDGACITSEDVRLAAELFASGGRELVVLGFAVVLGHAPLALEPAAFFHAVERGIEGALLDLEVVVGGVADPPGDGIAVRRAPGEGLEDEEVE